MHKHKVCDFDYWLWCKMNYADLELDTNITQIYYHLILQHEGFF